MLMDPGTIEAVKNILTPDDFYPSRHKQIIGKTFEMLPQFFKLRFAANARQNLLPDGADHLDTMAVDDTLKLLNGRKRALLSA